MGTDPRDGRAGCRRKLNGRRARHAAPLPPAARPPSSPKTPAKTSPARSSYPQPPRSPIGRAIPERFSRPATLLKNPTLLTGILMNVFLRRAGEKRCSATARAYPMVGHPSPRPSPFVPHGEREPDAVLLPAAPARTLATIDTASAAKLLRASLKTAVGSSAFTRFGWCGSAGRVNAELPTRSRAAHATFQTRSQAMPGLELGCLCFP